MRTLDTDIVIVGGGVGGIAAALSVAAAGFRAIVTEPTRWIGGQLTSQAVPPDEHRWIESEGATARYREFRDRVRDHYRRNYPLTDAARALDDLNPGNGLVSAICHEPAVALAALHEMLAPHVAAGRVRILHRQVPVSASVDGDRIEAVVMRDLDTGEQTALTGRYVLDASELGDLLPLAGVEHVTGAESTDDTGEPHAIDGPAQPLDQQAFSVCFALEYRPGENHVIDRPADYAFWETYQADFWPNRQLSWDEVYPDTLRTHYRPIFQDPPIYPGRDGCDLWRFRQILDASNFVADSGIPSVTLVNWQQMDYWLGPLVGVDGDTATEHERRARQLSLSFLYWMQTEAPRLDGGTGYAGLRLRTDIVGETADGLAMYPYIRESRRIVGETRVVEQHVGVEARGALEGAEVYPDSVGVGSYRIDLHPSTGGSAGPRTYVDVDTWPYQIPMGALVPVRMDNLLPAAKNIATTHITNGCYRLHPAEWNIGEASGALAAHCLRVGATPRQIRNRASALADFQQVLTAQGIQLAWSEAARLKKDIS
jgi:FAD dependent oxidoreductase